MAAGTFTSRDTYAGRIGDILSQNRYTYAENNPVTYADPSGHISIKSAWNAVKTGAKTAASAARAVTSAVTAAVKTGASAVSNAIKGAVSKPTVKLGHPSSKTVNQTPSAYAKVSGASRNQAVQQKAAKSAAWADLVGQPVSMCEAAAAWADWGAEKAAGYVDESLIGNGAMLAALKVKAAECWAYSQLENSIHLIIPEADVERMLRGAGLMLGGGFKSFGGFMLALGSSTISWTGLGVLGIGAGIFVVGAGASDMNQGAEEFFLGMSGDSTTPTRNGMSDLFYDGNDTIYHLSTGTAAMAGSMMTPYVNGVYGKAGVTTAGSTAGNGETAGATAVESGAGNAQTAGRTVTESGAGKPAVIKSTAAEAAGGTADDALEQFYDDIFESSYGEQFDPVKEQAIAGPGEIAEPSYGELIQISEQKMYQIGQHFNKHGLDMGYISKKEYDVAARTFLTENKNFAEIYEGVWNSSRGGQSGQVQIIVRYEGKQLIINKESGQIIDFYEGTSLEGFINVERKQ